MTNLEHTKKVYDKYARMYHDKVSSKDNVWHKYIEKPAIISLIKKDVRGKSVLDLGCGSGPFVKELFSLGVKSVKGLDLSKELIKIARENNPRAEFSTGDARKTPYKNGEFEIVVSSLMAHYFKDLNPLFSEVSRILKNRGLFVFSMHHPVMEVSSRLNLRRVEGSLLNPYFHNKKYVWTLNNKMKMIAYHHTFENIINSLSRSGFVIENVLEPQPPKNVEKIDKNIYKRANRRPSFLLIRARKKW